MTEMNDRILQARPRRFRQYSAYKDSGVGWLGKIPEHWEAKKWRYCCHVTRGQVAPDDEQFCERVLIAPNHIESGTGRILHMETANQQGAISGKYLVKPGDIIYSKIRPALNKVCISTGDWLCSADMYPISVIESRLQSHFLLYFMLSKPFVQLMVDESMRVAMPKVNRDKLATCPLLVPDSVEQRAIAAFLDRETTRIDGLVERKERLIELLREKRTALITRAVTRGLDPNVPVKDSGVEWLGEIPAHWKVTPLRFACRSIETGGTPSIDYLDDLGKSHVNWFTPGDFGGDLVLRDSVRKLALRAVSLGQARLFPADSVFVVGIGATLGKVGLIERPASANQQVNVIIPRDGVESYFLAHFLLILGDVMATMANSATLPILNQRQMGALHVPIPPVPEQDEIIAFVRKETAVIDVLIAKVRQAIDLLREFRTALISAAATGKIDVREEAA